MASVSTELAGGVGGTEKLTAPYGSWKSPITAATISGGQKRLGGVSVDGAGRLIWLESRPTESAYCYIGAFFLILRFKPPLIFFCVLIHFKLKSVIFKFVIVLLIRRDVLVLEGDDEALDLTPKEFAVRTSAQEYGGGSFGVHGETVIFSNYDDQRLYKQSLISGDSPAPITPDYGGPLMCFADGVFDLRFQRYIAVMDDRRESSSHPTTTISAINLGDDTIQEPKILVSGNDFYAFPRIDPKGERLAWIEWGHPNMPWDKSQLWVGYISEDGKISKRMCVAGGDPSIVESPTEPQWTMEGELFFVTDRKNGFWNLYKWVESENEVLALLSMEAEFTGPLWNFGLRSYVILQSNKQKNIIACSYRQKGRSYFGILNDANGSLSLVDIPFTDINSITLGKNCLFIEGASATLPVSVAKVTLDDKLNVTQFKIMWSSSPESATFQSYFSLPELIEFPTEVPGQNAYAFFYPPSNPMYQANQEEKPPLLLQSHGGPTCEAHGVLNLSIQYWTSRGWAVVDVNYGGSTGYGREYRERLLGNWGVVDVNDCCSCAKFLVDSGKVDANRLCITGESAGGYTTLAALAFKETFKIGASLYGIGDLKLLSAEIPKFESHYIDNLVGNEKAYHERSPINHVDRFSCPIVLFQGLDDTIVPPSQARKIYRAMKDKGLPVALVEYEGEPHGFRKAENIKFTIEQQMLFFARLVGNFNLADDIAPIKIDNVDS